MVFTILRGGPGTAPQDRRSSPRSRLMGPRTSSRRCYWPGAGRTDSRGAVAGAGAGRPFCALGGPGDRGQRARQATRGRAAGRRPLPRGHRGCGYTSPPLARSTPGFHIEPYGAALSPSLRASQYRDVAVLSFADPSRVRRDQSGGEGPSPSGARVKMNSALPILAGRCWQRGECDPRDATVRRLQDGCTPARRSSPH